MKQAKEFKQISKERMSTYSEIDQICMNESTEKVQVQIPAKKLKQYFPDTYTKTQMEEIIFMLLASWAEIQVYLKKIEKIRVKRIKREKFKHLLKTLGLSAGRK